jgi:hypothetical protein
MSSQSMKLPLRCVRPSVALALCGVAGCVSAQGGNFPSDAQARPAVGVPAAFTFSEAAAADRCRNPATDPRDGARLALARSNGGRGDYEVADGKYGVGGRQYLRLDCATGAVVGVVPR